jgi:hypothetical protein
MNHTADKLHQGLTTLSATALVFIFGVRFLTVICQNKCVCQHFTVEILSLILFVCENGKWSVELKFNCKMKHQRCKDLENVQAIRYVILSKNLLHFNFKWK